MPSDDKKDSAPPSEFKGNGDGTAETQNEIDVSKLVAKWQRAVIIAESENGFEIITDFGFGGKEFKNEPGFIEGLPSKLQAQVITTKIAEVVTGGTLQAMLVGKVKLNIPGRGQIQTTLVDYLINATAEKVVSKLKDEQIKAIIGRGKPN